MEQQQHAIWKAQAKEHWAENLPAMYARLTSRGKLDSALTDAAEATGEAMASLQQAGQTWEQAWEQARTMYLFLPAEPDKDKMPETEGFRAHRDLQRGLGSLTMPGEKPPL